MTDTSQHADCRHALDHGCVEVGSCERYGGTIQATTEAHAPTPNVWWIICPHASDPRPSEEADHA